MSSQRAESNTMSGPHGRGEKALKAKDYATAIKEFTAAIKVEPTACSYYISRCIAYIRDSPSKWANVALEDADAALVIAKAKGRRPLMGEAQFWRAKALYHLTRYEDAKKCLAWAKERNSGLSGLPSWELMVQNKIDAGSGSEATILEDPGLSQDDIVRRAKGEDVVRDTKVAEEDRGDSAQPEQSTAPKATTSTVEYVPPTVPKSQFFEDPKTNTITISLMIKGVPKDKVSVEIERGAISLSFPLSSGSEWQFAIDPLYAAVIPEESKYEIRNTKVDFILKKAVAGKWPDIKGTEAIADATESKPKPIPQSIVQGPAYPTSSKSGPKDWDKLARDLSTKPKVTDSTADEEDKKEEDDPYISDDEGGDPVNGFFKKLFKNADPDTRRAMMKSYTESNGTALSTNWAEVKQGKVETKPPDGMEAKEWDS